MITKRIGVETFNDKLAEIAKHVIYTRALKHPQNRIEGPTDLALDHEFCRLHKGERADCTLLEVYVTLFSNRARGCSGEGGGSAVGLAARRRV